MATYSALVHLTPKVQHSEARVAVRIAGASALVALVALMSSLGWSPVAVESAAAAPTATPAVASAAAVAFARTQQVFVVGDSLAVGAAGPLNEGLKGYVAGVEIDAQVGRHTSAGSGLLRASRAQRSSVWVVQLGTNDGPNPGVMRDHVQQVMRLAGPTRRVLWVNIVRPGGYGKVNAALKKLEHKYLNYEVLDWAQFVSRHRSYLSRDGVHLTSSGYQAMGSLIANATVNLAMTPG